MRRAVRLVVASLLAAGLMAPSAALAKEAVPRTKGMMVYEETDQGDVMRYTHKWKATGATDQKDVSGSFTLIVERIGADGSTTLVDKKSWPVTSVTRDGEGCIQFEAPGSYGYSSSDGATFWGTGLWKAIDSDSGDELWQFCEVCQVFHKMDWVSIKCSVN